METNNETNARLHYDLRLWVNPLAQQVRISGSLVYHAPPQGASQARFYLNKGLKVRSIEGRRVLGYHFELKPKQPLPTWLPESGTLDVHFDPPLAGNNAALVQFELEGRLNLPSRDWIELSLPLAWYPVYVPGESSSADGPTNPAEGFIGAPHAGSSAEGRAPALFSTDGAGGAAPELTFTLQVTCPAGYAAASLGETSQQGDTWHFNWPHPTNDIVVVVGRHLRSRSYESESNRVQLHSVSLGDEAAGLLGEDLLWALERFAGWFGPVRPAEFTVIQSPRVLGQGYARRGLVVLANLSEKEYLDQREAYLRCLAHEAAHTWWWAAPSASWEDWLNESFAEYSALMAIRERYGAEIFNRRLERKREQAHERLATSLPLWGFDRTDTTTAEKLALVEAQLYDKGPLLLHELAERTGHRRFIDLCRAMQWSEVHTTAHFLDLLEEVEDTPTRTWMEEMLKNP